MGLRNVKIYDFDGETYRFVGRTKMKRENNCWKLTIAKTWIEQSVTGQFLCVTNRIFVWCFRYEPLMVTEGARKVYAIDRQIVVRMGG